VSVNFNIAPVDNALAAGLQNKIDQKTKPLGSLGQLETLAFRIGLIQNNLLPQLNKPSILIFAGDHGIAASGVSAYPQSVTAQMLANFLTGGAAVNVFAKQNGLDLVIVDAGVNADLASHPNLIAAKIAKGTQNYLHASAMTITQCNQAIDTGASLVLQQHQAGCDCIGFGEMGIGNTSSAALLMHCLTQIPLEHCVGRGTGLNDQQLQQKVSLLQLALQKHPASDDPIQSLCTFGGFEIAMMVGAYLKAAELGMVIMVDGFIACSALLIAAALYPAVLDYCIFSHVSDEQGHRALLAEFSAKPLLDLQLRLGEGSGIALAYPLLTAAVNFLNTMASFTEAGVDNKTTD